MAKSLIAPGAVLDGFAIGECVHHGGMATLWSVTRPDISAPLLMKIPRVAELGRLTIDRTLDEEGHNKHVDRLVALKHRASPLTLDQNRLTVHVLEAVDPASAILEFAGINQVDHIIIGARENSTLRSLLGSVSSKVASEARCTVTVVRPPRVAGAAAGPDDRDMPPVF